MAEPHHFTLKGKHMEIPHIDTHPVIKPLLHREAELNAQLHELRRPAPDVAARDNLEAEARRLLGDETEPAPLSADDRHHLAKVIQTALRDLQGRIRDARNKANAELVKDYRLIEQAAALRQSVADAALALLDRLEEAEQFTADVAFAELGTPETWPGSRRGLRDAMASFLLRLEEAGAKVETGVDLYVLAGLRTAPPPDWELRTRPPAAQGR
jgi:hypothetical protein